MKRSLTILPKGTNRNLLSPLAVIMDWVGVFEWGLVETLWSIDLILLDAADKNETNNWTMGANQEVLVLEVIDCEVEWFGLKA